MCSVTWVVPRTISYQRSSAAVVARFRALTNAYFTHARENFSLGGWELSCVAHLENLSKVATCMHPA